jgi:hypothetical protein
MSTEAPGIKRGKVVEEYFDLLLGDTGTTSEKVKAALRDHLVVGLTAKQAINTHGVTSSHFYNRLKDIRDKHAFVGRALKFNL